ncbi:tRNA-splicing endonuclease subunit Sen2 isoform X2 [Orussus abietinus]|nr:tRNA-splicing endonuclease subunit Sen2 isoform X2 [Orussus abietinus]XP_012282970.1 tRNA-splicing endonuclease subunit Sen2 isoform X2 [Orussus abietinus]
MEAVYTMGFFGKGSLSRSYPSFVRENYRALPTVRRRQWMRRQEWCDDVRKFDLVSRSNDLNEKINNEINEGTQKCSDNPPKVTCEDRTQNSQVSDVEGVSLKIVSPITDLHKDSSLDDENTKEILKTTEENIVEVILDSAEDEDVCEVPTENKEVILLNDEEIEVTNTAGNSSKYVDEYDAEEKNVAQFRKILVLPDSDSETEDYLKEVKPKVESEGFPIQETLHLTFQETFFLMFGLSCLQVINFDGNALSIQDVWTYFSKEDQHFIQKYIVYHYFRSKGWVVKPGLKYGGDYLLYKQGPPFYHASYIVIIDVVNADTLIRESDKAIHKFTWDNLIGLERLSETAAKEILFAQILWPSSLCQDTNLLHPNSLSEFTVKEILWRRWVPKQTREVIYVEEEDEDSS